MNDLLILAMLSEGPRHGYQLKRQAGFIFGHGDIHNNLVYPLLRKFTVDGWVTKKAVPGERGQTRQQYAITPLGKTILLQRLSEYSEADARSFAGGAVRVARSKGARGDSRGTGKLPAAATGKTGRLASEGRSREVWRGSGPAFAETHCIRIELDRRAGSNPLKADFYGRISQEDNDDELDLMAS